MFFAYKSRYSVIQKAAVALAFFTSLSLVLGNILPLFYYKIFMFFGNWVLAKIYWDLSDNGWFSTPIYFLEIGLIWALYYFLTVAPDQLTFFLIYNRFADLANFFMIGCAIYRIRMMKKLERESLVMDGLGRIDRKPPRPAE